MSDDECCTRCNALAVRADALEKLIDEREERTKERFESTKSEVGAALAAADRAILKAEIATEKRFEGVNEFRETLRDQAATLMPRSEYDVRHNTLIASVQSLNERISNLENVSLGRRAGLSLIGQIVFTGISMISAVGVIIIGLLHH